MCGCISFFLDELSMNDDKCLLVTLSIISVCCQRTTTSLHRNLCRLYVATIALPRPHSVSSPTGLRIRNSILSTLVQRPSMRSLSGSFSYTERIYNAK